MEADGLIKPTETSVRTPARAAGGGERRPLRRSLANRHLAVLHREAITRRSLAVADILASFGSLAVVTLSIGASLRWPVVLVPPLFVLAVKAVGLYDRDEYIVHKTTLDEFPLLFGLGTVAAIVLWLAGGMIVDGYLGKLQVLELWVLLVFLLASLRGLARALSGRVQAPERCLVLGDDADGDFLRNQFELNSSIRAFVVGVLPAPALEAGPDSSELPAELPQLLLENAVDRVIIARPQGNEALIQILRRLRPFGVRISLMPRGPRISDAALELDHLPGVTLLGLRGLEMSRSSQVIKRSFDLAGASSALILLSPCILVITLAILITSGSPVLFRQRRVGRNGREFTMLKFRSMINEAEQMKAELLHRNDAAAGLFKITADPRVTPIGRILRRLSLDELPQLWNVLRGEMSLVGPRPLVRDEDGQIEGPHRRRLEMRPGMTGHWQILDSQTRITLAEMARLDYLYVANWTLWNDLRLLLRTVPFVVGGRGV